MSPDAIKLAIVIPLLCFTLLGIAFSSRCQLLASGQLYQQGAPEPPLAQSQTQFQSPNQSAEGSPTSSTQTEPPSLEIEGGDEKKLTRLLLTRFGHLFVEEPELSSNFFSNDNVVATSDAAATANKTTRPSVASQLLVRLDAQLSLLKQQQQNSHEIAQQVSLSPLETRNDEILNQAPVASESQTQESRVKKRQYFRVLDHVFSRVELPQVFRSPKVGSLNSYCANFIGCIDDIPGLPAILRRSNISSTFTIYTASRPQGLRVPYEPLAHHQLGDVNLTVAEIASRLQAQQKHQLAAQKHLQNQLILLNQHPNPLQQQILQLNQINKITNPLTRPLQINPYQSPTSSQQLNQIKPNLLASHNQLARQAASSTFLNAANAIRRSASQQPSSSQASKMSAKSWQSGSILKRVQDYPFDLSALEASGFQAREDTRVIIGGYFAKEDEHWIEDLVDLWRQLEPQANIIKVSWPDANRGLYHSAALNSRVVGRQLSLLIHYLDQMFSVDLAKFHLVGHSLGAHIAGFVGSDNGGRVGRITGLDPAGPIFIDMDESMRLDPRDGLFVDVVHTNAGSITKGALGLTTPSGHVDYYPNGGSVQPGCISSGMAIMDPVERVACNHRRSYRYFIEILRLTLEQRQQQQQQQIQIHTNNIQQNSNNYNLTSGPLIEPVFVGRSRRQRQASGQSSTAMTSQPQHLAAAANAPVASQSIRPTAFLFEAKEDELDRLGQPDLLCLGSKVLEPCHRSDECELSDLPARRLIEFHTLKTDFPTGRRGLYYLKTRPEAPFFSSRQFGVTLRSANQLKRKIAISMKLDKSPLTDFDIEQIDSSLTVLFVPTELSKFNLSADLWFMWRYKSFTLLSSQPDELSLSGLELLELESTANPSVIKYSAPNVTSSPQWTNHNYSQLRRAGASDWPALVRNRWYKFERN